MSKLTWDQTGEKLYETGTDHGVLFVMDKDGKAMPGVAWNGLTGVTESPDGAEETNIFADNQKYLGLTSAENYKGTIEAFTYPDEFMACDGSAEIIPGAVIGQQTRKPFGFSWRTLVGNDTEYNDYGYKLHIVYAAKAAPSERAYATVNDSPEAITFSWEFSTTPQQLEGYKPTSSFTLDSTKIDEAIMKSIEDKLYGSEDQEPTLPTMSELVELLKNGAAASKTTPQQ